ncbi:MAG: SEC-C metal-binding domain-containing protein [Vicinamibacterales bacterium]
MAEKNKPGRNEPCACGSGKKYKQCCEGRDRRGGTFWMYAVGGIVLAAVAITIATALTSDGSATAGRVWSSEHGHWHNADGTSSQ